MEDRIISANLMMEEQAVELSFVLAIWRNTLDRIKPRKT